MSPEPQTPEALFAPPCESCAQAKGLVIGAVVAGAVLGVAVAWVVFGRK